MIVSVIVCHKRDCGVISQLSAEWVDYVEEPMKYQAFIHYLVSVDGWLEGSWGGRVCV